MDIQCDLIDSTNIANLGLKFEAGPLISFELEIRKISILPPKVQTQNALSMFEYTTCVCCISKFLLKLFMFVYQVCEGVCRLFCFFSCRFPTVGACFNWFVHLPILIKIGKCLNLVSLYLKRLSQIKQLQYSRVE